MRKGFAAKGLPMPTLESKFGGLLVTSQRPVEGTSKGTSRGTSKVAVQVAVQVIVQVTL